MNEFPPATNLLQKHLTSSMKRLFGPCATLAMQRPSRKSAYCNHSMLTSLFGVFGQTRICECYPDAVGFESGMHQRRRRRRPLNNLRRFRRPGLSSFYENEKTECSRREHKGHELNNLNISLRTISRLIHLYTAIPFTQRHRLLPTEPAFFTSRLSASISRRSLAFNAAFPSHPPFQWGPSGHSERCICDAQYVWLSHPGTLGTNCY